MPLLARKIKGPLWANASEATRWKRPEFPFELLTDLVDKDGAGFQYGKSAL
jgi:hypothetical protein